jgi:hypothetical protein
MFELTRDGAFLVAASITRNSASAASITLAGPSAASGLSGR